MMKPKKLPEDNFRVQGSITRRSNPWRTQAQEKIGLLQRIGQWLSDSQGSLLILQTQIRGRARAKDLAVELISLLKPQHSNVIWHLSIAGEEGSSATRIIKTLIYQCMTLAPNVVQSSPEMFSATRLSAPHSHQEWVELLWNMLKHMGSCFIIVEAEDLIGDDESQSLDEVWRSLQGRLKESPVILKLLIVKFGSHPPTRPSSEADNAPLVINIKSEGPIARRMPRSRVFTRGGRVLRRGI